MLHFLGGALIGVGIMLISGVLISVLKVAWWAVKLIGEVLLIPLGLVWGFWDWRQQKKDQAYLAQLRAEVQAEVDEAMKQNGAADWEYEEDREEDASYHEQPVYPVHPAHPRTIYIVASQAQYTSLDQATVSAASTTAAPRTIYPTRRASRHAPTRRGRP